ncbi:MAG: hypothetical protein J0J05_11955 [Microbacterium sp.]|uniref:hypothetical protein n=1 Tax=Microbacterium sp. TaxID=51671 RepID=UPI001ACAB467|nr:hypothetical protein [Microbacterium sp.]MBN9154688.1 hypothetical protein [Microbacterium sp.]
MKSRISLPPELCARPFSIAEADRLGVPRTRLRRRDLKTPVRGVRVASATPPAPVEGSAPWITRVAQVWTAARIEHPRMAEGAAFSHFTAAVIHGFPLRTARIPADRPLDVTTYADSARRRRAGVTVHPLPRDERRVIVDGLQVTHPVDTWCALSAVLTVDELIEIGDHLVRRQAPDATLEQLHAAVRRYAGRHGAKRLRQAVELVRTRTDSPRETWLRLVLRRAGLPEPEINVSVRDGEGRHIKLGDLVYERERVLVEYDGEQHRTDPAQYHKDTRDLERAVAAGWAVIQVDRLDRDEQAIVRRVRAALAHPTPFTDGTRRLGELGHGVSRP